MKKKIFIISVLLLVLCGALTFLYVKNKKILNTDDYIKRSKPDGSNIIELLERKNNNKQHPRILASNDDFKTIRLQIANNREIEARFQSLRRKADIMLYEPPVKYEVADGVRLLEITRKVLDRVQTLSFIYKITGESKYAERAWIELETVSGKNPDQQEYNYNDWDPKDFLVTAEMTNAAAIGYDWLYDYLSEEQKTIVRDAIVNRGLKPALDLYRKKTSWVVSDNNWNAVCNGGIGMGALAIADEGKEYEKISGEILEAAIKSLPNMLKKYYPDGGWYEGTAYWVYGTTYTAYLIASLDSSLGTDFGLSNYLGLSYTGDFPMYLEGVNGQFNFGDAGQSINKSPVLLWLANKYNKPEYAWYFNKATDLKDSSVMGFIWGRNNEKSKAPIAQDKYFKNVEVVGMHTALMKHNDSFIGFKAGENGLSHGDLDIGSFVYETLGVRWINDLGSENYNLPGYFDTKHNDKRWEYYRKRAESHNTLTINPSSKPDQDAKADTKIITFKADEKKAFAIADLTDAYKKDAVSVIRGIEMYKDNGRILIQDEITTINKSYMWWFANTKADIKISSDKKSVILSKDGKRLWVGILSPSEGKFRVIKSEPLPSSPNPKGQTENNENKLAIHLSVGNKITISVMMCPLKSNEIEPKHLIKVTRLDKWNK
ncbi:heparinase II/III family protein [Clostridium algoriphilum]|uniref:heparinase II/III domain-containing protein n=1 Tax=Clostridium algoriphilum TaxID=198347 RepID=UPI001CF0E45E|nr:heparinase II/III family protein [Clostridium algoriphilum]MCB2295313.1 heparinase II/III family protein [Clostridium algoriphilum]